MASGIRSAVSVTMVARLVMCGTVPGMASFLRKPFSALTSLVQPPRPGTPRFALWNRFTGANNAMYRLSGGRLMGSYDGNPVVLLHHVGRRSGEERLTPPIYLQARQHG